jgi:hypothetical protein
MRLKVVFENQSGFVKHIRALPFLLFCCPFIKTFVQPGIHQLPNKLHGIRIVENKLCQSGFVELAITLINGFTELLLDF